MFLWSIEAEVSLVLRQQLIVSVFAFVNQPTTNGHLISKSIEKCDGRPLMRGQHIYDGPAVVFNFPVGEHCDNCQQMDDCRYEELQQPHDHGGSILSKVFVDFSIFLKFPLL